MGQPFDSTLDEIPQKQLRRSGCIIALAVVGFVFLCTCYVFTSMLYDSIFMRSVALELLGWRFEAKYEVSFGVSTKYSKLSFQGEEVGQSLPRPVNLVTPVGEFVSRGSEWDAVWSDPRIWDEDYRLPDLRDGQPWVTQVEHASEVQEFLAKGACRAPGEISSNGVPWINQQLKGTPAHWVYVYRLSWPDANHKEYESHAVEGYWVDPAHLDNLVWE